MKRPTALVAIAIAAALIGGCSIRNDETPRDIPAADQRPLGVDTERLAGAAQGTSRDLPAVTHDRRGDRDAAGGGP